MHTRLWPALVVVFGAALTACPGPSSRNDAGLDGGVSIDPRCAPDASSYLPRLSLVSDAGKQADDSYLMTDAVEVRVDGLPPCFDVPMTFALPLGGLSYGLFRSDFGGTISTARDAPLEGTWGVADRDGPLWSMQSDIGGARTVSVTADLSSVVLSLDWRRSLRAAGTDVLPVRGYKGVWGDLYVPPGAGPFPGIVAVGGSEGGLSESQALARAFVAEGYLVFALAYFDEGNPNLPARLEAIPLEYFDSAIDILKEHERYDVDAGVGLIGVSRGSEAALLVASRRADVKAVIGIVPSAVAWSAERNRDLPAWSRNDAGLPFVPRLAIEAPVTFNDAGMPFRHQVSVFTASLAAAAPSVLTAATPSVENINGPVLLFGAGDDQVWPSCTFAESTRAQLRASGHDTRFRDEAICFANASHATSPAAVGLAFGDPIERDGIAYGGTAQGTGQASRAAWASSVRFLEQALKQR